MSGHDIGLLGLGLFLGYYLYIVLNYREVEKARREEWEQDPNRDLL